MTTQEILNILVNDIHTTVVATSEDNKPITSVIDMMLTSNKKLYFITAKGKAFYKRLTDNANIALSGIKGEDTLSSISISLRGLTREIGSELLEEVFEKNSYMSVIYPTTISRKALTVFEIYQGQGEYFDLSQNPLMRSSFVLGDGEVELKAPFIITNHCKACGDCIKVCPTQCISKGNLYLIDQSHCLHCGNCYDVCKYDAIIKQ